MRGSANRRSAKAVAMRTCPVIGSIGPPSIHQRKVGVVGKVTAPVYRSAKPRRELRCQELHEKQAVRQLHRHTHAIAFKNCIFV